MLVDMRYNGTTFASVLIVATALMFVALLGHPAAGGHGGQDLLGRIYAARFHLGTMHAAAIGLQLVVLTCLLAFCGLLGLERPLVAFAAVSLTGATAAICVAGSLDGFLIPAFSAPHLTLGEGVTLDMPVAIAAGAIVIQYATKFGITLMAVSVLLLSAQLLALEKLRVVGVTGICFAVLEGAVLVALPVLTPHNVAYSALPLILWQLVLGIVWRRQAANG
jgi:hypothetical protein